MERYLNPALSPEERADDLLPRLSKEEIIAQLQNYEIDIDDARRCNFESENGIGFISAEWMQHCESIEEAAALQRKLQERAIEHSPHKIPAVFYIHAIAGTHVPMGTSFPSDLNRGANFNTKLEECVGEIVARQSLSLGINFIISPVMDITRDYFVERLRKTYGQARTLGVIMGAAYLKGIRSVEIQGKRADALTDLNAFRVECLSDKQIERMAWNILKEKFRFGLFEHPFALEGEDLMKPFYDAANYELTRMEAEESLILLKNKNILPFTHGIKKIALIGPHAEDTKSYYLTDMAAHRQTRTIHDRICHEMQDSEISYAKGYDYEGNDESGFEEALANAKDADIVIMTLGMNFNYWNHEIGAMEIEENCGKLPPCQERFIEEVKKLGKPLIGIHLGVHPFASELGAHELDVILEALLPAEATAEAIVDVLTGKVNPCGRLPIEVYDEEKDELMLPFGHGLSFSNFLFSNIEVSNTEINANETFEIRVHLHNKGPIAGCELMQLYMVEEGKQEFQKLVGLRKVFFLCGEGHDIVFTVDPALVASTADGGKWKVNEGKYRLQLGKSATDIVGEATVTIHGTEILEGPERVFYSKSRIE